MMSKALAALVATMGIVGVAGLAGVGTRGGGVAPAVATSGAGGSAIDDAAIAVTVNGTPISTRRLLALAADRPSFAQFRAQITEGEIGDQLVRDEAARRHLAPGAADERELDQRMPPAAVIAAQAAQLGIAPAELTGRRREAMRAQQLLRALIDQDFPGELTPSDAALRLAFERAPLAYAERPTAAVRGLLIPLAAGADAAQVATATDRARRLLDLARGTGSAAAFSQLAADNGVLPPAPAGADGALGTLALADPFEPPPAIPALFGPALAADVAQALFPGPAGGDAVIGPFRGPLGVFGLFVEQRQTPSAWPRFEQVRDRVRARWIGRAVMTLGPRLIKQLRVSATIEWNQGATAS